MNEDIFGFAKSIKDMGYSIKLDTNGSYPERLQRMIDEKLCDYVAMDIKNCKEKYALTAGLKELDVDKIDKSVKILLQNKVEFEFRTTVVKELHTTEDIIRIGDWICGAERYFLQNFVDSGNLIQEGYSAHDVKILTEMKNSLLSIMPKIQIRGV